MKHILPFLLSATTLGLTAQNANVVNAYNYMQDGKLDKAVEYIEPATLDPKTGASEKTWRYRGNIYRLIALGEDTVLQTKYPDAIEKAIESYLKAVELDTKGSYKTENVSYLGALQGASLNSGNDAFLNKDYDKAIARYGLAERIAKSFAYVDTNAIFNAALAYETKGDAAMAIQRYRDAIAAGYNDAKVYAYITGLEQKRGNTDAAIAAAKEGLERFPGAKELRLQLTDLLIAANRSDEAEASLRTAIEADPGNANLWFALGNLYDKKSSEAKDPAGVTQWSMSAEDSYKKSIDADPKFFDAYFNIGVLYNNRAASEYEKCNVIKSDTEYMKCKKTADEIYLKAVPYFEQAHVLNEADMQTIQQLIKLYGKTNDTAKYEAMKAKLAKLQ
ncbi:MAG: tetratricopeptide repeat protein [Flavobacteriales bacterium]|nr:tetratricopeptide repeat protein [Flavobacteriales bacterium]